MTSQHAMARPWESSSKNIRMRVISHEVGPVERHTVRTRHAWYTTFLVMARCRTPYHFEYSFIIHFYFNYCLYDCMAGCAQDSTPDYILRRVGKARVITFTTKCCVLPCPCYLVFGTLWELPLGTRHLPTGTYIIYLVVSGEGRCTVPGTFVNSSKHLDIILTSCDSSRSSVTTQPWQSEAAVFRGT